MTDIEKETMEYDFEQQLIGVDSVEIKLTLPSSPRQQILNALNLGNEKVQKRSIYFFDTPLLGLFNADVILRARLIEGRSDDTTVKLKRIKPEDIGKEWTAANNSKNEEFKVEADFVGSRLICAASLTVDREEADIQTVISGQNSLRKIFSDTQEHFLTQFAKIPVDLDSLDILGPINALLWKPKPPELEYEITVEEWYIPNVFDVFELSTKVKPKTAKETKQKLVDWLLRKGFEPADDQETKTKTALSYLTSRRARV